MRGLVPFAAALLVGSVMVTAAGQAPPAAGAPPQAAQGGLPPDWLPPAPKNLKLLPKDIEPKQLLAVMQGFAQSMGVRCVYCHVAGPDPSDMSAYNFESDRKENKEATRAMMKYTDAVNESFPKDVGDEPKAGETRVTCYTCHQGQRHPPTKRPEPKAGAPVAAPQGLAPRPPA